MPLFNVPLFKVERSEVTKHTPGGHDHDQSSHGNWASGQKSWPYGRLNVWVGGEDERGNRRSGMDLLWDAMGNPPESDNIRFGADADGRPVFEHGAKNRFYNWEVDRTEPIEHLFRVVSERDYQRIVSQGYVDTDGNMNLDAAEGLVTSARSTGVFYAPQSGHARIIRIDYRPEDDWKVDPNDQYVKTHKRIPIDRVSLVSPLIEARIEVERRHDKDPAIWGDRVGWRGTNRYLLAPGDTPASDLPFYLTPGDVRRAGVETGGVSIDENDQLITKHTPGGHEHDQSSHGNWAHGRGGSENRFASPSSGWSVPDVNGMDEEHSYLDDTYFNMGIQLISESPHHKRHFEKDADRLGSRNTTAIVLKDLAVRDINEMIDPDWSPSWTVRYGNRYEVTEGMVPGHSGPLNNAKDLAEARRLNAIDTFVGSWATSSSDHNAVSLALQYAVAHKYGNLLSEGKVSFDLTSDWRNDTAEQKESRRSFLTTIFPWISGDDLDSYGIDLPHDPIGYTLDEMTDVLMGREDPPMDLPILSNDISDYSRDALVIAEAIYKNTQEKIERFIQPDTDDGSVTLYRGMSFTEERTTWSSTGRIPEWVKNTGYGEVVERKFLGNPIQSMSSSVEQAEFFANGSHGVLLSTRVSLDKIFSTPFTGVGAHHEKEFVTIAPQNQPITAMVTVIPPIYDRGRPSVRHTTEYLNNRETPSYIFGGGLLQTIQEQDTRWSGVDPDPKSLPPLSKVMKGAGEFPPHVFTWQEEDWIRGTSPDAVEPPVQPEPIPDLSEFEGLGKASNPIITSEEWAGIVLLYDQLLTQRGRDIFHRYLSNTPGAEFVRRREMRNLFEAAFRRGGRSQSVVSSLVVNYDPTSQWTLDQIDDMVFNVTSMFDEDQKRGIQRVLREAIEQGLPETTVRSRLRNYIGLDPRQEQALTNYYNRLLSKGVSLSRADDLARRLSGRMRTQRINRLVRTELNRAIEAGKLEFWKQAYAQGLIKDVWRVWHTHPDERRCKFCAPLDGKKARLNGTWVSSELGWVSHPPLHVNCRCWTEIYAPILIEGDELMPGSIDDLRDEFFGEFFKLGVGVNKHGDGSHDDMSHGSWATGGGGGSGGSGRAKLRSESGLKESHAAAARISKEEIDRELARIKGLEYDKTGKTVDEYIEETTRAFKTTDLKTGKIGTDSMSLHAVQNADGTYSLSQERSELHDQILRGMEAKQLEEKGIEAFAADKHVVVMAGLPGSGKSHLVSNSPEIFESIGFDPTTAVKMDADAIKDELIFGNHITPQGKYKGREHASYVHEESSLMSKEWEKYHTNRGTNMILDITGMDGARTAMRIEGLVERGYTVSVVSASIPLDVSMLSVYRRFSDGGNNDSVRGRPVPVSGFLMASGQSKDGNYSVVDDNWSLFSGAANGPSVRVETFPVVSSGYTGDRSPIILDQNGAEQ